MEGLQAYEAVVMKGAGRTLKEVVFSSIRNWGYLEMGSLDYLQSA